MASTSPAGVIPDKQFFKIGEVAKITGLKPYVLRYWEQEFSWVRPSKTSSRQRLYRRQDVAMLLQIKRLRYKEHHTIASARECIKKTRRPEKRKVGASFKRRAPVPAPAAQLGLGLGLGQQGSPGLGGSRTADLARRLAEMRRQVMGLLESVKE